MLLAVPNFSEGRDPALIDRISAQFASGVDLLDTHSDPIHNRTVLTLRGRAKGLGEALVSGFGACQVTIDMRSHQGAHPRIGALDVCPVVWLVAADRDAARGEAFGVARTIGDAGVPVFLYGELAAEPDRRERAFFRDGGLERLRERMEAGEVYPDFGPDRPHPTAGATLVTARPPLAAFNLLLDTADVAVARAVGARLRESGGGLPGVRAIGIDHGGRAQVSSNVHDPIAVPLATVVERVRELAAEHGAAPAAAEIVGLVPEAAMAGFPADVPLGDFDPAVQVIERRVGAGGD